MVLSLTSYCIIKVQKRYTKHRPACQKKKQLFARTVCKTRHIQANYMLARECCSLVTRSATPCTGWTLQNIVLLVCFSLHRTPQIGFILLIWPNTPIFSNTHDTQEGKAATVDNVTTKRRSRRIVSLSVTRRDKNPVSIEQDSEWAPEPIWAFRRRSKICSTRRDTKPPSSSLLIYSLVYVYSYE